jgi:HEAT repeat protein
VASLDLAGCAAVSGLTVQRKIAQHAINLRSQDPAVRQEAVIALGNLRDVRATRVVEEMLNDPDTVVRANAAAALGKIGDRSVLPSLQKALSDKKHLVRWDVVRALGTMGDSSVVPDLARVVVRDPNANVRRAAVEALGSIGDQSVVPALIGALGDNDESVAYAASQRLERLTGKRFGPNISQWQEWWAAESRQLAPGSGAKGGTTDTPKDAGDGK